MVQRWFRSIWCLRTSPFHHRSIDCEVIWVTDCVLRPQSVLAVNLRRARYFVQTLKSEINVYHFVHIDHILISDLSSQRPGDNKFIVNNIKKMRIRPALWRKWFLPEWRAEDNLTKAKKRKRRQVFESSLTLFEKYQRRQFHPWVGAWGSRG